MVFRDEYGNVVLTIVESRGNCVSVLGAELQAILLAVNFAKVRGFGNVLYESDSKLGFSIINMESECLALEGVLV